MDYASQLQQLGTYHSRWCHWFVNQEQQLHYNINYIENGDDTNSRSPVEELKDESGAKNVGVIKSHEEKVDLSRLVSVRCWISIDSTGYETS